MDGKKKTDKILHTVINKSTGKTTWQPSLHWCRIWLQLRPIQKVPVGACPSVFPCVHLSVRQPQANLSWNTCDSRRARRRRSDGSRTSKPARVQAGGRGRQTGTAVCGYGAAGTQAPTGQLHHRVALAYLVHILEEKRAAAGLVLASASMFRASHEAVRAPRRCARARTQDHAHLFTHTVFKPFLFPAKLWILLNPNVQICENLCSCFSSSSSQYVCFNISVTVTNVQNSCTISYGLNREGQRCPRTVLTQITSLFYKSVK